MKKLICALMLMVMLMPVMAMAAVPAIPEQLDLANLGKYNTVNSDGSGTTIGFKPDGMVSRFMYTYNGIPNPPKDPKVFEAEYYMSGQLASVRYYYDCGCTLNFSPSGQIQFDPNMKPCDGVHAKPVNYTAKKTDRPADSVLDYVMGFNDAQSLISLLGSDGLAQRLEDQGDLVINGPVELYSAKLDGGNRYFGYSGKGQKFIFVGPVVYNVKNNMLRVYGDKNNNSKVWAQYDTDTAPGKLDHYAIFAEDGTKQTAYSNKNQVMTIEIWDENGEYWGYDIERDTWEHSTTGMYEDAAVIKNQEVPQSILEKILVAPGSAAFAVTSKSGNPDNIDLEDKGAPVVIGGLKAETVAEMKDIHTSVYQMKVQNGSAFDEPISLLLPYAPGQNKDIAQKFTYTVKHEYDNGKVDAYSTEPTSGSEITVEFTKNGVLLKGVSSFSPFTVTWGDKQAAIAVGNASALPATGDDSNLALFMGLMMASAAALFVMGKRREN